MKLIKEITDMDILGRNGLSAAKPRLTARAILKNRDNLYAVMHSEKFAFYSFPGGGVEENEKVTEALKREIFEETGCRCDIIEEIGSVYENRACCDYTQISYYFAVTTNDFELKPQLTDDEIRHKTTAAWFTLEETIKIIKESVYFSTQQKYLQARDIAALEEYLKSVDE